MSHSAKIVSAIFYEHTLATILAVSVIHAMKREQSRILAVMHESNPGVTIPPPRNLPDRQFTGVGNLPFIYVHGGRVLEDRGDLTNGCPQSHPQILRQQNLVSGTHVGALIVFCALMVKVA
jgi:hypothetical protein